MRSRFIYRMLASLIFCALYMSAPGNGADLSELRPFDMTALGRPFFLGMLYDQKSDQLIPGYTLWDVGQLNSTIKVEPFSHTFISIEASDSLESRYNLFDINMQLKLSLLGGLVKVSGSAKYLHNEKSSMKQSRVTLKYSTTTRFESLNMNLLAHLTYNNKLDEILKLATHVVTGVVYGADACFDFEAMTGENEEKKEVEGKLEIAVKSLPSLQIEGNGAVKIDTAQANYVDRFSLQLFSDFDMSNTESPTTYLQAVKLYKQLPQMLGPRGEKAIPKQAYLFPIHKLDDKAGKLMRDISSSLVDDLKDLMQSAEDMNSRANDIRNTQAAHTIGYLASHLAAFQQLKAVFMDTLLQMVVPVLPTIRAGGLEESVLSEILKRWHASPFSPNIGTSWLAKKAGEAAFLDSLIASLGRVPLVSNLGDVFRYSLTKEHVFALELSLPDEDDYLELFRAYNDAFTGSNTTIATTVWKPGAPWYSDPSVNEKIQPLVTAFRAFANANEGSSQTQFAIVVVATTNKAAASAQIRYYRSSKEVANFQLPSSAPFNFNAVLVGDNVTLTWNFQDTDWITGFQVSYTSITVAGKVFVPKSSSVAASVNTSSAAAAAKTTITLAKGEVYTIDVRWVMDAGNSIASANNTVTVAKKGSIRSCNNSLAGYDLGVDPGFRGYGDVNGDGWPDYCRIIGGGVLACHLGGYDYQYTFISGRIDSGKTRKCEGLFDVKNDGKADFCRVLTSSANNTLTCLLAGPTGFTQQEITIE